MGRKGTSNAIFLLALIVGVTIFCLIPVQCPTCKGDGFLIAVEEGPFGIPLYDMVECPTCHGKGTVPMIVWIIEWFKG